MKAILEDPEYAKKHSHPLFRKEATCTWAIDINGELYFKGAISGHSFMTGFIKLSHTSIPMDRETILKLADFIRKEFPNGIT